MALNARRPAPGSLLANWLTGHGSHPDAFVCGVRVVSGEVTGESARWRYTRSAVDPLQRDGVHTLNRGKGVSLSLRVLGVVDAAPPRTRPGLAVLDVADARAGARLLVAVPPGELIRFGIEGL